MMALFLFGAVGKAEDERKPRLNLVVLEGEREESLQAARVLELNSAEFPEVLTQVLLGAKAPSFSQFGLPANLLFLDAYAAVLDELRESKKKRRNFYSQLEYRAGVRETTAGSSVLSVEGEYDKKKFPEVQMLILERASSVAIIPLEGKRHLFFVATPVDAIPLAGSSVSEHASDLQAPKLLEQKIPSYPDAVLREKLEAQTLLVRTVVGKDGRIDISKLLLLEVTHPEFLKSAVAVLPEWEFEPGMKDGQPVNVRATIEFQFKVR